MLAESMPWWTLPLGIVSFVVGWILIGKLMDRFSPPSSKKPPGKQLPKGEERKQVQPGEPKDKAD